MEYAGRLKLSGRAVNRLTRLFVVNALFVVLPSYVLHYHLGLYINYLYPVVGIASLLICLYVAREPLRGIVGFVLLLLLVGTFGSLLSGVSSQLFMATALSLNLMIAFMGWHLFADRRTLDHLLYITSALVLGAAIGLLYAYFGGPPLDSINLHGRESYLYLTTFTNAVTGNLIRPAGIFDEPGALAMYVTLIVSLNEALRTNTKWSAALLAGSLVSGSLALFLITIVYILLKLQGKNRGIAIALCFAFAVLVTLNDQAREITDRFFFDRLEVVDGTLAGDNRTHQIQSFFSMVDWKMTLHGQKALGGHFGEHDLSSNPFTIYYGYGLVIWLPYLALQIWLIHCAIFYRPHLRFPAVALFLTMLQRPYLYSMAWGAMIAVLVVVIYRAERDAKGLGSRKYFLPRRRR